MMVRAADGGSHHERPRHPDAGRGAISSGDGGARCHVFSGVFPATSAKVDVQSEIEHEARSTRDRKMRERWNGSVAEMDGRCCFRLGHGAAVRGRALYTVERGSWQSDVATRHRKRSSL